MNLVVQIAVGYVGLWLCGLHRRAYGGRCGFRVVPSADHWFIRKSLMRRNALLAILLILSLPSAVWSQDPTETEYRDRGDRYEGIRPEPVGGGEIELVSALVDYREPTAIETDVCRLRFYLSHPGPVAITVRELDGRHYYWMDRLVPPRPWKTGFDNIFSWPAEAVIRRVSDLQFEDLGALARLTGSAPSSVEKVAPVILYHESPPSEVEAYIFTFEPSHDARIDGAVLARGATEPLRQWTFKLKRGGEPFAIRWDCAGRPDGPYTLKLSGWFLDDNFPIDQTVHFHHHRSVEPPE
jgi:hypothetical protein